MKMRDEADHKAMLAAGAAWLRIKKSAQRNWSDWTMTIGPALMRARSEAMATAYTNRPKGKGYSTAMSGLLSEYRLDDMDGVARNDMISIMENLAAVDNWRNKQKNPTRLNHPTTVWRGFKTSDDYKAVQMERGEYEPKPEKTPPREKPTLLEEAATLRDQVIDLKGQLEERTQERDQAREEIERLGGDHSVTIASLETTHTAELEAALEEIKRLKAHIAQLEAALDPALDPSDAEVKEALALLKDPAAHTEAQQHLAALILFGNRSQIKVLKARIRELEGAEPGATDEAEEEAEAAQPANPKLAWTGDEKQGFLARGLVGGTPVAYTVTPVNIGGRVHFEMKIVTDYRIFDFAQPVRQLADRYGFSLTHDVKGKRRRFDPVPTSAEAKVLCEHDYAGEEKPR